MRPFVGLSSSSPTQRLPFLRCFTTTPLTATSARAAAGGGAAAIQKVAGLGSHRSLGLSASCHHHHLPSSASSPLWCPRRALSHSPLLCARRMQGRGRRTRHREAAEGDWHCPCGEVNYRSKRECFKCGAPAPPLPPGVRRPSLPGEDPHDWACPCGQMNFRGSVVCHKCAQPKPDPPPEPGKEITLWTCPGCKGVNRSNRRFCFKCGAQSPLSDGRPPAAAASAATR